MSGGGGAGGFIASRDDPAVRARIPDAAPQHLRDRRRRARVRHRPLRADVVRQPRGGQRLDGELGLPLGDRQRRVHVVDGADGFAELGRLILARSHYAARRLGAIDGVRDPLPGGILQGVRRRLRRRRQDRGRDQHAPTPAAGSSVGTTSPATSPGSGRARCTASPRFTRRSTSTGWPWRSPRRSRDAPPLPRGRLGRAARDGDGRSRSPRCCLRPARAGRGVGGRRRRGTRADPHVAIGAADAAGALGAGGAAPLSPPLAGDARNDGREPVRDVHDEVQPARSQPRSRRGPRSRSCIPTKTARRCRASSSSSTGST